MTADHLLTRALHLAEATTALASPNPQVGCVLADASDKILGEGAHHYADRDHAEIVALQQAGTAARGASAYVTLEPCAHHGRTPPCANALIAAGVARVVIASIDPNPLTRNLGIARLRDAGITVDVLNRTHPIATAARRLNDAFALSIQRRRPMVTLKAALSVDGKLAPPPSTRTTTPTPTPVWLTGPAARADVQQLRHASDAILTGIGTVLADDPSLTDRTNLPRRRPLLRVILDSQLRTPLTSNLVKTAANDLLILTSEFAPIANETALTERGTHVLRLDPKPTTDNPQPSNKNPSHELDLSQVLQLLHDRQILSVLTESGSALNASLLRAALADKLVLYYSEQELGPDAVPFAEGFNPYTVQQSLTSVERTTFPADAPHHEDVRITGYLTDPWSQPSTPYSLLTTP